MKTLIIVESPTKARTIEKFLGKNYTVRSCMGHIRDLPKSSMGVDIEHGFEPHYITIRGKGDVIKTLKDEAKKADRILLASDPDREGEAIAWHLQQYLNINETDCRIRFNEITDKAIKNSVQSPLPIDIGKVEAQQARRILDRLVGYGISPLLWKKVKKGLSAGRVQSVAVRLICDRENEIKVFVSEEYWTLYAYLIAGKSELVVKLIKVGKNKAKLANQDEVEKVIKKLSDLEYIVDSVQTKEKKKNPAPPFTTSSMQQEASRRLGMMAKKTMQTAQQLYEGIAVGGSVTGLISYMRTDSVRISDEAQANARVFIESKYGKEFVPVKPNVFNKSGANIQNAHEAIRPTSVERTPSMLKPYLTAQQYKLYKLIWERFVASQMAAAILDITSVNVKAGEYIFSARGSVVRFPGFTQVYTEGRDEKDKDKEQEEEGKIAPVKEGEILPLDHFEPKQHFTQPPVRYTEAMLIKSLEELGIGRPSTYAPIIDTILARCYVVREEKQLYPTELGILVVDLLKEYFTNIIDVEFTANLEKSLDMIAEGNIDWVSVLSDFYKPFARTLSNAEQEIEKVVIAPEKSDEICEKCGKPMVYRMGRYGRFLACSGFPECRNTKAITKPLDIKCLACGGNIVQRKSRTGRVFYGCDNYPKCSFVSWDLPIEVKCESCGYQLTQKTGRDGKLLTICPNKDCPTHQKHGVDGEKPPTRRGRKPKENDSKKTNAKSPVKRKNNKKFEA